MQKLSGKRNEFGRRSGEHLKWGMGMKSRQIPKEVKTNEQNRRCNKLHHRM